jgi:hypothetical protein
VTIVEDTGMDDEDDDDEDSDSDSDCEVRERPKFIFLNKYSDYVCLEPSDVWNPMDYYELESVAKDIGEERFFENVFHDKNVTRVDLFKCGRTNCVDPCRYLLLEWTRHRKCRNTLLSLHQKHDGEDLEDELVKLAERAAAGEFNLWPVLGEYLHDIQLVVHKRRRTCKWSSTPLPSLKRMHMRVTVAMENIEAELKARIRDSLGWTRVKNHVLEPHFVGAGRLACFMDEDDPVQPPP